MTSNVGLRSTLVRVAGAAACVALAVPPSAASAAPRATPKSPINPSPFIDSRLAVRANVLPAVGDFDCDGKSDVFWYGPGAAPDDVWYGQASASKFGQTRLQFVVNGRYRPFAGDFNGDGCADILWVPTTLAPGYVWLGHHNRTFSSVEVLGTYGLSKFGQRANVSIGDFNGDGNDDFMLSSSTAGGGMHIFEGSSDPQKLFTVGETPVRLYGHYVPIAADFNGDGYTDIYWSSLNNGQSSLWTNHGSHFTSWLTTTLPATSFAGDFDGDHKADLFEYAPGSFAERIWYGTASSNFPLGGVVTAVPNVIGSYLPVAGDFDGNGRSDVIWYSRNGTSSPFWIAR